MRRKIVVANWKMHGSLSTNQSLLEGYLRHLSSLQHTDVVVCVPYPYLAQAQTTLQNSNIHWGAQNLAKFPVGAYTGEVSAEMLRDFGSEYVILGHSERSTAYCESSENIADKFMMAKTHQIKPILCVGETLQERESGVMERVIAEQLNHLLISRGADVFRGAIISYEPIWAIGTGLSATPEQAQSMHEFIRALIKADEGDGSNPTRIIYGGSVNPNNASLLMAMPDVDGALVGRCALSSEEFVKICLAAEKLGSQ